MVVSTPTQNKKRDFRRLWIQRINAGARQHGIGYSSFVHQAKAADVELNRKVRRSSAGITRAGARAPSWS